jgi:periplasmic protein CpxP/Spy
MKTQTKIMLLAALLAVLVWNGHVLAAPQDGGQGGRQINAPGQGGGGMQPMAGMPGGPGMGPGAGMPGMGQGPGGPDGMMGAIMHKLDLTDEQREKIETIMDENHAKTSAARRAVEKARRSLEEAIAADANEPVIRKAAAAVGTAIGDEAVLKVKTMKEIKAVLTPEQIKKLDEIKAEMKSRPMRPMQDGQGGQRSRPMGSPPSAPEED